MIEIGRRNIAPASQHPFHDIYLFHIDPAKPASAQPVGRWKALGNWLKRNIHVGGRYGI